VPPHVSIKLTGITLHPKTT